MVVPQKEIESTLAYLHKHEPISLLLKWLKLVKVYIPSSWKVVPLFIKSCETCQRAKSSKPEIEKPFQTVDVLDGPFKCLQVDC